MQSPELFAGPDLGIQALQTRPVRTEPATGHICVLQHRAAWAVHAYLRFVGLPYSTENVAQARAMDLPLPVMLDGHFITSSKVILPYIQQTYSIGPMDPEDAKHASWIITNLEDALSYLTTPREELHLLQSFAAYFLPRPKESKSRFEGFTEKEVITHMEPVYKYMHERLADREFIGGFEPGMADAVLFQHVADVLALVDTPVRQTLFKYKHLVMFFRRICNRYFNFYDFDAMGVMVAIQLWEESNKVIRSNEQFRQSVAISLDVDVFTPLPEDPSEVVLPTPVSVTLITPIGESPPLESILHSEEEPPAPGQEQPAGAATAGAAATTTTAAGAAGGPARRGRAARPSFRSRRLEFPAATLLNKKLRNAADRTFITYEANLYDDDDENEAARPRNRLLEELTEGQLTLMKAKFHLKQQRFEMNNRVVKQNRPKRMKKAKSATRLVENQPKQRPMSLQQGSRTLSASLNSKESKAERLAALRQPIGGDKPAVPAGAKEAKGGEAKPGAEGATAAAGAAAGEAAGAASTKLPPTIKEEKPHANDAEDDGEEEEEVTAFEEEGEGSESEEERDNGLTLQEIVAAARGEGLSEYLPEHADKMEQEKEAAAALGLSAPIPPLKPAPKPLPSKSPKQYRKPIAQSSLETIQESSKEPEREFEGEPALDVSHLEDLIDFNDQDQVRRLESAFARAAPIHDDQVVWMWPTLLSGPADLVKEEVDREVSSGARQRWELVKQATSTAFIVTSLSMLAMYTQKAF